MGDYSVINIDKTDEEKNVVKNDCNFVAVHVSWMWIPLNQSWKLKANLVYIKIIPQF